MQPFSIPVNYIRQYIFCPRIPYFLEILQIRPAEPLWVEQGGYYHNRQELLSRNRTLQRFNLSDAYRNFHVYLVSSQYGVHGVADLVLETKNAVFPVEFKTTMPSMNRGHKLQLYAYGIMAGDEFAKSSQDGFIVHQKKGLVYHVPFTQSIKIDFENTLHKLNEVLNSSILPFSSASYSQCSQCEYLNFCNDRF